MNKKGQEAGLWASIFVIVFALAFIFVLISVDIVDASHQGVKVRFGKIIGTMDPGMQWTGPFVKVHQYDLRTRSVNVAMLGEQSSTDKDGQTIYGEVSVNYRIKPNIAEQLYSNIGRDEVTAERLLIDQIIREGFKQATVKYEAIEILDKRQEVKELAKTNIANNFPSQYFTIEQIVVSNIDYTPQFKKAIEDKKVATQDKLKEQERLEVVRFQQAQEILKYEAEAKKLELQKKQITDQLNTQAMISAWDGAFPQTLIITETGSGANLFLQMATGGTQGLDTANEAK